MVVFEESRAVPEEEYPHAIPIEVGQKKTTCARLRTGLPKEMLQNASRLLLRQLLQASLHGFETTTNEVVCVTIGCTSRRLRDPHCCLRRKQGEKLDEKPKAN